jgi:hypothetical protein
MCRSLTSCHPRPSLLWGKVLLESTHAPSPQLPLECEDIGNTDSGYKKPCDDTNRGIQSCTYFLLIGLLIGLLICHLLDKENFKESDKDENDQD